jgi:hypothetical protein
MAKAHQSISERAEAGSGQWFLISETFLRWGMGEARLLWCPGIRKPTLQHWTMEKKARKT